MGRTPLAGVVWQAMQFTISRIAGEYFQAERVLDELLAGAGAV